MTNLSRLQIITLTTIALLGASLAVLAFFGQIPLILIFAIILSAFWSATVFFGKPNLHLVFFVIFLILISIGILGGLPAFWMILLVCLDIAAWNLGEFTLRMLGYNHIHNERQLENHHLKQLGSVLGIGFVLAVIPTFIHVRLSFILIIFLVVIAVALAGIGVRGLREKEEEIL